MRKRNFVLLLALALLIVLLILRNNSTPNSYSSTGDMNNTSTTDHSEIEPASTIDGGTSLQFKGIEPSQGNNSLGTGITANRNGFANSYENGCGYVYLPGSDFSYVSCDK